MATWAQMKFQDASSPLMEELVYLHDYILITLTFVTLLVLYGLATLLLITFKNHTFLEKQNLETMWTLIPALILMFMAFPSLQILYLMDETNAPLLTMKTMGHQWYWSYEYTDYKKIEFDSYMLPTEDLKLGNPRLLEVDNRLILPHRNLMRILVTSTDVLHSWSVPSLAVKMDAVPGRLNQISFLLSRTGVFYGQCSEICGANHSFMPIVVEAVPFKIFEKWIASIKEE